MKKTLRDKIESQLEKMIERKFQLDKNALEYSQAENYTDAAVCKIKSDTLAAVIKNLNEILENH